MCCNYVQKCTFVILLAFSYISAEKPIVETTHGLVQGKVLKTILGEVDYYGFFGIPYAAPPLKDLRFLPPQPIEPWDEVLVATKEKKACIQSNTNILKGQKLAIFGAENCLYLNIFTPNADTAMRPVIVFLYNHHFVSSYNKTKDYSPDFFIEEDIVIVTVEHRLSVMGFLSLEDEIVPGNSGLRDIVAALEWVKKNVAKFGGDPDKITLMGSRGGAAAVDFLVHSTAKHLFSAAIIQGGTSLSSIYLQEEVKERAHKLGEVLERASSSNAKLLKELNELPAEDLIMKELQAAPVDYFKENQRGSLSFSPVVEKQPNGLITEYPEDSKHQIDIPIMIGYNSREGLEAAFQYLEEPRYLSFVQKDFPFIIPIRVKYKFDPAQEITYKAVDEIKDYYYDGRVKISHIPEHVTYLGDVLSAYPIDYTVKMYAGRTSNSLYYYLFDYVSDFNENQNNIIKISTVIDSTYGAAASDELCYLFYCPDLKKNYIKHNQSESEEIIMLRRMVKLWANFAKYRNPTPEGGGDLGGLEWPTYKLDNKNYLHIGKQIEVKTDLFKDRFEFWDNFIKRWEQRAVNGIVGSDSSDISDINARETNNTTSKDEL